MTLTKPQGAKACKRSTPFRRTLRWAACAAAAAVAAVGLARTGTHNVARAETPASAPPATGLKEYTEALPGTTIKFQMVPIPGGKFTLGSPADEKKRKPDEGPQVEVQVDPFYMEQHEVTWAEYNEFLRQYDRVSKAGAKPIPPDRQADIVTYPTPMYELEAGPVLERMGRGDKFPAVIMSQFAAKQYTKWLSKKTGRFYRLPSEAEWEYACRAGTKTAYSFGDDPKQLKDYGWFFDNSDKDGDGAYREVMKKKPNPWGLYDMHGNAAEFVIDQYEADWYKTLAGKGGTVSWQDAIRWPDKQFPRIVRGGSWNSEADECRSASRFKVTVSQNDKDPQLPKSPHWMSDGFWIGFRVISPAKEPPEAEKAKWWDIDNENVRDIIEKTRAERQMREPVGPEKPAK